MNYSIKVISIEPDVDDLVNLFSTALYGEETFDAWVPDTMKTKSITDPNTGKSAEHGLCYEDKLANTILNDGYIYIRDNEDWEYETEDEAMASNQSKALTPVMADPDDYGEEFAPVYKIDLERIKVAFTEIIDGTAARKSKYNESLEQNFRELFSENGNPDFYDAWNILQYIVFGEVIYG